MTEAEERLVDCPTKNKMTRGQKDKVNGCAEDDVLAGTKTFAGKDNDEQTYVCQATQLPDATEPLQWWDVRQYIEDYLSGNVGFGRMICGFIYMGYNNLINAGIGLGEPLRWLYDMWQGLWQGVPYPQRNGKIPAGQKTPNAKLDLQPGEFVRIKSYKEILETLDLSNKNRGLQFGAELVPYCGGVYRVLKRVNKIIDEKTGKMLEFKNSNIILESVVCKSRYSECRLFCPRSIYSYWREIWLERDHEAPR